MPLLSEERLQALAGSRRRRLQESVNNDITRTTLKAAALSSYDIFLSHSFKDKKLVLGLAELFESLHYSVYIDWKEDAQLDRGRVDKATAETLRQRLSRSAALFYVRSMHENTSKWMPWELGYMDGKVGRAAILPVRKDERNTNRYIGQEYLGLYPYVTVGPNRRGKQKLWVMDDAATYVAFDDWLQGRQPYTR
jgi:hypothetical protein